MSLSLCQLLSTEREREKKEEKKSGRSKRKTRQSELRYTHHHCQQTTVTVQRPTTPKPTKGRQDENSRGNVHKGGEDREKKAEATTTATNKQTKKKKRESVFPFALLWQASRSALVFSSCDTPRDNKRPNEEGKQRSETQQTCFPCVPSSAKRKCGNKGEGKAPSQLDDLS